MRRDTNLSPQSYKSQLGRSNVYGIPANRTATRSYLLRLAPVILSLPATAIAATRPCSPSDTSLACRLTSLLNWLEATAVILGIILLAVIGITIHLIRKNRTNRRNPPRTSR